MHYKRSVFRSLAMVTQLGICVVTPVFLCIFAGYQLDNRFGTKTMLPLLILGVLAGGRCAWIMARKTLEQEKKEDDRLRRERKAGSSTVTGTNKPKQPSRIRKTAEQQEGDTDREDSDGMADKKVEKTDS